MAFTVWLVLLCSAAVSGARTPGQTDPGWRHDAVWDDGKAELCAYEVDWAHYGTAYPGRALLIVVKEPWAPELDVKADTPRPDGFEVLKLNHVRDVPTGIYTYHQMASVYLRRDDASLVKLATTSSEACGISTALMVDGRLETHSYFDGQGDRTLAYPEETLPRDGLPVLLRDWVAGNPPTTVEVFPSLLAARFPELEPASYRVRREAGKTVDVPAGSFEVVEIRLARESGWLSYSFGTAPPHPLVRFESSDGTRYEMARCDRIPYWEMNRPGGENWLPEELRPRSMTNNR